VGQVEVRRRESFSLSQVLLKYTREEPGVFKQPIID
jgi:hypothetical protein